MIDLEKSLLRSDLVVESFFALLKENPVGAMHLLARMVSARNRAVAMLESSRDIDAAHLPFNADTLAKIHSARQRGTPIVLFSRDYDRYAHAIADHLQLFDRVIAAGATAGVAAEDAPPSGVDDERRVHRRSASDMLAAWVGAIRLHQWLKNLLIFVPLVASHWVRERDPLIHSLLAFLLFGFCASSVYLLNDLLDLSDDRHHPSKRFRALANGRVSIHAVLWAAPSLLVTAIALAWWLLPLPFVAALSAYYALTLAYSLVLKRIMMLDVVVLAMLYTLRVVAGTFAIEGALTFWMLAFSLFIFMSLALAKRYAELLITQSRNSSEKIRGRGYLRADLPMISSLGAASGYIAVMVLALYIQDQNTIALYRHPKVIWLACPLLLFWIGRTWMLTHRGLMHDDPLVFAIRDRVSLIVAALFSVVFLLAAT